MQTFQLSDDIYDAKNASRPNWNYNLKNASRSSFFRPFYFRAISFSQDKKYSYKICVLFRYTKFGLNVTGIPSNVTPVQWILIFYKIDRNVGNTDWRIGNAVRNIHLVLSDGLW
jgi:hypothetical protein